MTFVEYAESFRLLYEEVTERLVRYSSRTLVGPAWANGEIIRWFLNLIAAFWREFRQWPVLASPLNEYLSLVHKPKVPKSIRLAAHIYLHIAYDLPRVIADSLASLQGHQLASARAFYLAAAPEFRDAFNASASVRVLGLPAVWLRVVPWRDNVVSVLLQWVLALRNAAWIHAEILANSPNRPRIEANLKNALLVAAQRSFAGKWPPNFPDAPVIAPNLLAAFVVTPLTSSPSTAAAAIVGLLVLGLGALGLNRYRKVTAIIDRLGAEVLAAAAEAVSSPERWPPSSEESL